MKKTMYLASAALITYACAHPESGDVLIDLAQNPSLQVVEQPRLKEETIVDFTHFSYSVAKKEWKDKDKALFNKLLNDGWKLEPFTGTTGAANNQVESVSGLLAFKDEQVVIASRGTQMTNCDDWLTNFRFSRSPISRFFATDESNKLSAITAQFFGGVDGEIANGFLQTHLSSWDYIQEAILKRATSIGLSPKNLHFTIIGHSLGGAKAQLNALNLLTDPALGIGTEYLEKSFVLSEANAGFDLTEAQADLFASGFYGVAKKTSPENKGNVEAVVFESPRLFSDEAATNAEEIIGKDTLIRVENKGMFDSDPVPHLSPEMIGFKHAGTTLEVDKGFFVGRHSMGNVGEAAIPKIAEHRQNVAALTAATTVVQEEALPSSWTSSFAKTLTNLGSAVKSTVQELKGSLKSLWV